MATHDYVINNDTAANVRADINNALAAIRSSNLSATEPANLYAGLFWFDTTNDELKLRNEANDGWIVMGKFSGNSNTSDTPSGAILQFAGSSAPSNWLLCDGALVSRTTYATLFGVIGTNYGAGDGSSTFKLPDLRGRVPIGAGQATGVDENGQSFTNRVIAAAGGAERHTLTVAQIPAHSHAIPLYDYSDGGQANLTTAGTDDVGDFRSNSQDPVDNTGGNQPHNNMQPFLVVNHIIKV
jgi:microcystin-dependent protein